MCLARHCMMKPWLYRVVKGPASGRPDASGKLRSSIDLKTGILCPSPFRIGCRSKPSLFFGGIFSQPSLGSSGPDEAFLDLRRCSGGWPQPAVQLAWSSAACRRQVRHSPSSLRPLVDKHWREYLARHCWMKPWLYQVVKGPARAVPDEVRILVHRYF